MDDASSPLLIIGDIHGQADRLLAVLLSPESEERHIVFVGDLVNRGPHSRRVLETVLSLESTRSVVVLRGNHEQAVLDVLAGGPISSLLQLGGAGTILDYVGLAHGDVGTQFRRAFPADHLALLQRTVPLYEQGTLLVTHDGRVNNILRSPSNPNTTSLAQFAIEGRFSVFGHYPQRSELPVIHDDFACLDTGAGSGGPLTAFLWPERTYIQR